MKKMDMILRKCKTLSRQLGRSSSYSSLRSKSCREEEDHASWGEDVVVQKRRQEEEDEEERETIYVGRSRRRYSVSAKHLKHPIMKALINKSEQTGGGGGVSVKCEVVFFEHLLWMLDNANLASDSLEELADLYLF